MASEVLAPVEDESEDEADTTGDGATETPATTSSASPTAIPTTTPEPTPAATPTATPAPTQPATVAPEPTPAAPSAPEEPGAAVVASGPDRMPRGMLDTATVTSSSISLAGWALDEDTAASIDIHIYVDGVGRAIAANLARPDVARAFGRTSNHGFATTIAAGSGAHSVCVYAINANPGAHAVLGCRTVVVPTPGVRGNFESAVTNSSSIRVSGWALNPDNLAAVPVYVSVDGVGQLTAANLARTDVARAFGRSSGHGFSVTIPALDGRHTVCATVIGAPLANLDLGCRTVTVTNQVPRGNIDSITVLPTGIKINGWALDPDTRDPIAIHVYVDGVGRIFTADTTRTDVGAVFGLGDKHGFAATFPVSYAKRTVCVYAINSSAGTNVSLGCHVVGNTIVELAAKHLGTPYLWGGSTPTAFDCSGLTSYVYAITGVRLPRTSLQQRDAGQVIARSDARPGDLIWSPGHIAIYAGGNQQIDATPTWGVKFRSITVADPVFLRMG